MSALSIQVPFPVFQGRDGQPLENGYVWIGEPNLNPQTNPVVAYYDAALTIPAPQPLRTLNGYISRAGTPAQIYVDGVNFSILVQDSKGSMVYNFPDGTGISPNAAGIEYDPPFTGAVTSGYTVQDKLEQTVSVKDFGAVGDGVTDDTAAIQAAVDSGATSIQFSEGTYKVTGLSATGTSGSPIPFLQIQGIGNAKLILANASNSTVLYFNYVEKLIVDGLEIDGNAANQSAGDWQGIDVLYCKDLTLTNNKTHDCYFSGIRARGIQKTNISGNYSYSNGTGNTYPGDGITFVGGYGAITNNVCYGNNPTFDGDGIQVNRNVTDQAGWWTTATDNLGLSIVGNSCYANGRRGIKVQRSKVTVTGNTCVTNELVQISVTESTSLTDVAIVGNIIGDADTSSAAAINSSMGGGATVTNLTVVGNTFAGTVTNNALDFDYVSNGVISGNSFNFVSVTANTLYLRSNTSNVQFEVGHGLAVANTGTGNFGRSYFAVAWAAAAPTTGTWSRGDVVWNSSVNAGGSPGWICTTAGTPGTWKAMAVVAA